MADRDDVRARVEDALQRAASTAYEAAHGAIEERETSDAPTKWRVLATPRVAVTATLVVALVVAMIAFMPRDAPRATLSMESARAAPEAPMTATVVIHVAGAVASPGVYTLDAGMRVGDAVAAAGGAVEGADTDALNLARELVDGEQVKVPIEGAVSESNGLINVNVADAAALEKLPGVGPVLAGRIVTYRDAHGPFSSIDALDDVSGVGPAILEQIRAAATV